MLAPRPDSDRTLAAYHAAGHCVVAYFLGGGGDALPIGQDVHSGLADCCPHTVPNLAEVDVRDPDGFAVVDEAIAVCMAGHVAEAIVHHGNNEPFEHGVSAGHTDADWRKALYLAAGLSGDPTGYIHQITSFLVKMLLDYWPAVERLAQAAVAEGRLDEAHCLELLSAALHEQEEADQSDAEGFEPA